MNGILSQLAKTNVASLTLREAYARLGGDAQGDIPFVVRLFENPQSPVAFPGEIDLQRHDYLHLLLNRGSSNCDEAFIVGFSMGNDIRTHWIHIVLFKLISMFLYPAVYRFSPMHLRSFDLGIWYGRKCHVKNINHFDFTPLMDMKISEVRAKFGIDINELASIESTEKLLATSNWLSTPAFQ